MEDNVDISAIRDVTPNEAPVSDPEPLTGKEKAGVSLTWGIIAILCTFLAIILAIFFWGESRFLIETDELETLLKNATPEKLEATKALMSEMEKRQESFRAFWYDTLQLILLNVLFPTLTALLGYVFGTSKNNGSAGTDDKA